MRTTVVVHESAAESLEAWMVRVANARGGNPAVADLFLAELQAELIRRGGEPDGVRRQPDGRITWNFNADTRIHYVIKDRPPSLFRGGARRVVIFEFAEMPGA